MDLLDLNGKSVKMPDSVGYTTVVALVRARKSFFTLFPDSVRYSDGSETEQGLLFGVVERNKDQPSWAVRLSEDIICGDLKYLVSIWEIPPRSGSRSIEKVFVDLFALVFFLQDLQRGANPFRTQKIDVSFERGVPALI